jgi:hypothetical protein
MNRIVRSSLFLALALAAAAVTPARAADCAYPRAPASMPDGNVASKDEMVAAMTEVKKYNAEMETYLACLDGDKKTLPADATDDQKKEFDRQEAIRVQKHNAAVDEMEAVTTKFNTQLKAFRARDAKKG